MKNSINAFCIAGTSSGSGKTTVTLALLRALYKRGIKVQPFKCGPDYIDPMFHNIACHGKSINLDCWMMGIENVKKSFEYSVQNKDCAVIEGVMGLFDSSKPGVLDGSTAQVSLTLDIPVILTVNCSGMAGSIAALVKGYCEFNSNLKVVGVIANKVGSKNHASILKESLELANLPPLIGYLEKNSELSLPERHLGLVPSFENHKSEQWFNKLAASVENKFNIDEILRLTKTSVSIADHFQKIKKPKKRLGIAYDKAFNFYYEDNLRLLENSGFELVKFSPLADTELPNDIDGIYIGGGFPEIFAEKLQANHKIMVAIRRYAELGGKIYAECGGFMYLTKELTDSNGTVFSMCGVIPARSKMEAKLHSLGYREVKLSNNCFLGEKGKAFKGHEFHWSSTVFDKKVNPLYIARGTRNKEWKECGYLTNNICASYIHIHFLSNNGIVNDFFHST